MRKFNSSSINKNLKSSIIRKSENSSVSGIKKSNKESNLISEDSKIESSIKQQDKNITTSDGLIDKSTSKKGKNEKKENKKKIEDEKKDESKEEKEEKEEEKVKTEDKISNESKSNQSYVTSSIADSEVISEEINDPRKAQMEKSYYLANLAIKIEDAEEAIRYSDEMAILSEEPLTREQRRVFCGSNYIYIEKLRNGLLYLNKLLITEQSGKRMIGEIKDLKEKIIMKRCEHVIRIINENLLPKKLDNEVKALYLKIKGDYYRYMAEISKGNMLYVNKQNAFHFYNEAKDLVKDFDDLNPTKLNISLNYSVFLNEVLNKRINSFFYAKEALYNALKSLKNCSEEVLTSEDMKDTLMIIEILNRNVEDWYKEEVGDIFEDERKNKQKEDEEKEKEKKKKKHKKKEVKEEEVVEIVPTEKQLQPRKSLSGHVPEIPNLDLKTSSILNLNSSNAINMNQYGKSTIGIPKKNL